MQKHEKRDGTHQKDYDVKGSQLVQQLVNKTELFQNEDIMHMLSSNSPLLHDALVRLDSDYRRFVLTSISHYGFLAEHAAKEHYEEDAARYRLLKELFQRILNRNWTTTTDDNNNGVNNGK